MSTQNRGVSHQKENGRIAPPRRSMHRCKQLSAVMCDAQPQSPLAAIDYRGKNPVLAIRCADGSLNTTAKSGKRFEREQHAIDRFPAPPAAFATAGNCVVAGEWTARVRIDGSQIDGSAWSSSVWTSNAEADYLELRCDLPRGGRIERGILLGRADRFALLYDAVVWPSAATIEIENRIELAEGIAFESTRENTEAVLRRGAKGRATLRSPALARLFPLALPEWREAGCSGDLRAENRHLVWSLGGRGQALFSPIWIDLDGGRTRQRLTWRRLTVGEGLRPVPDEVAVGYRLAVGQKQWLVYRALTARGNRTLLGHNLSTELLVARFGRDGEVDPLIEIE